MTTKKENMLIAAKGGKPLWVPNFVEDINLYKPSVWDLDPDTDRDFMGVRWIDEGPMGLTADTSDPPLKSISEWREKIIFPDPSQIDWATEVEAFKRDIELYDPERLTYALVSGGPGPFLRPINALGWEAGLVALYEEPEEAKAFIDAVTDFLIALTECTAEHLNPDIIATGDDFSFTSGPFIPKPIWDRFYKENMKRLVDAIHAKGALAQFHNCGNNGYLIEECMDIGVDVMELPMPNDGLRADKERFGSRLVLVGGWDRFGEAARNPDASETVVRQSVRDAIDTYGKDGAYIFWDGGLIVTDEKSAQKMEWLNDEVATYGGSVYEESERREVRL